MAGFIIQDEDSYINDNEEINLANNEEVNLIENEEINIIEDTPPAAVLVQLGEDDAIDFQADGQASALPAVPRKASVSMKVKRRRPGKSVQGSMASPKRKRRKPAASSSTGKEVATGPSPRTAAEVDTEVRRLAAAGGWAR